MNDILKQRLVGALILVALGVVFWPIIFLEPGDEKVAQQPRVPPPPAVDTTPIEAPDLVGLRDSPEIAARNDAVVAQTPVEIQEPEPVVATISPPEPVKQAPLPTAVGDTERARSERPEKLVIDSDGVPVAWILQVASVSSDEKAQALRKRLLSMNQKAYVKKVPRGGKSLYRVYIGPKFERAQLEKIQAQIDAEFGVASMIARYVP